MDFFEMDFFEVEKAAFRRLLVCLKLDSRVRKAHNRAGGYHTYRAERVADKAAELVVHDAGARRKIGASAADRASRGCAPVPDCFTPIDFFNGQCHA